MQHASLYSTVRPADFRPVQPDQQDRLIIGAIFADVDACDCHGHHVFYGNDSITWLRFDEAGLDGPRLPGRRRLCHAVATKATTVYGMPRIDFTGTMEDADLPLRFLDSARRRPVDPRHWMPQAYLGVAAGKAAGLYARPVVSGGSEASRGRETTGSVPPRRPTPQWGSQFARAFNSALANGLPLITPCAVRYTGIAPAADDNHRQQVNRDGLVSHRFACTGSNDGYAVRLPTDAPIMVRAGELLQPCQQWCHGVSKEAQRLPYRIADIELLRQAWLHSRSIVLASHTGLVFFPADLIATMAIDLDPVELIWDFSYAESFVDPDIDTVIFPPLDPLAMHNGRVTLSGEVDFCAGVTELDASPVLLAS